MNRKHVACSLLALALSTGVAFAAKTVTVTTTINGGGSSLAFPTYAQDFSTYTSTKSTAKAVYDFSYEAVGSGAGQSAFLNNNINYFEPVSATNTIGYAAGTLTYGAIVGTQVDFGASDAFLTASQLTNPATGSYGTATEGSAVDGPLIQVPTIGTPITIPYNQSALGTTALNLNDAQLCGVMSGKITDWHSLNSKIPAGTTITVVYRTDGSGTSFLLTQHLQAVCTSATSNVTFTATKTFASVFGAAGVPSNFIGESGSGGVANELVATSNSFGYLSPDYTSIAPSSSHTTSLLVASIYNDTKKKYYQPTVANTTLGLTHAASDATFSTPPATLAAAQDPLNWVPAVPQTTNGYPIVGYTTVDVSSCYHVAARGTLVINILNDILNKNGSYATITTNNGFVPLQNSGAAKFYTAIKDDFLTNTSGFNINIDNTTLCAGLPGR